MDGETVHRGTATGALSERIVVSERVALPVGEGVPLEQAALLGCAALTGVGAVLHAADVDAATEVAVIGAGGVGQFAIQGARIRGAQRILAVDPSPSRRELALRLGATEAIGPDELAAVAARAPVDVAFDAVGAPATTAAALAAVRPGGRAVVVGLAPGGARLDLDPFELVAREKTLTGSIYGSADPVRSLGGLLALVADGRLELEPLLGTRYPLDGIDDAVAEASTAVGGRVVLLPNGAGA